MRSSGAKFAKPGPTACAGPRYALTRAAWKSASAPSKMLTPTRVKGRAMRIALIVGAVALASSAAADPYDPPQPITPDEALVPMTPEALAQGRECGKLGAAWVKQHPLPKSGDNDSHAVRTFYGSKTNQCWLIKSDTRNEGLKRARHLIDAQNGIETMACF